jgi:Xaa-Pro aminopeptidase
LGPLDDTKRRLFGAVLSARDEALRAMRPGIRAAEIDGIARRVLETCGYGAAFRHPAGHGAGFGVADYGARPRLHPLSDDVLEAGMVLNLEPGLYVENYGGIRIADMVAITETGAEVLTRFHSNVEDLELQQLP